MITKTDVATRKLLARELARVNRDIEVIQREPRAEELEGFGDNTPLSDETDSTAVGEEKELASMRLSELLERAAALDEAVHRLDQGQYGVCISCNGAISAPRLRAVPEALRCTRCQEEAERAAMHEIHAHDWKRTEEVFRERRKDEEGESGRIPRGVSPEVESV